MHIQNSHEFQRRSTSGRTHYVRAMNNITVLCRTGYVGHWHVVRLIFNEVRASAKWYSQWQYIEVYTRIVKKMTTVNTVAIHNGVIVMTEVLRCTVNIDNERDHGNSTSCVHFGVMYATEYDMCCKRWQWRALKFENGWYCNSFGWYCNIQQKKRMILDTVFLNGWYSKFIQNDIVGHCMISWNGKTNGWYCKFPHF